MLAALALGFQLRVVALTRGGHGSLIHAGGECSEHPGVQTTVLDTVGAEVEKPLNFSRTGQERSHDQLDLRPPAVHERAEGLIAG